MKIHTLVLAVALSLAGSSTVHAGNKASIQGLDITSLDEIFSDASDIETTLNRAKKKRKKARQNVNEILGLSPKASFTDSLAELKSRGDGKITVAMSGSMPTLQATDAVPSDVRSAISAVNSAVESYATMLTNLRDVPTESKQIARKAKKLNVSDLRSEMGPFSISEISTRIEQFRTFKTNVEVTAELPKKANTLVQGLGSDIQAVRDVFPTR